MYIKLYQHPVGDKNRNNGLETQILLDTGATCSLINFDSYEQYCKLQPLQLNKSRSNAVAVNGENLKLIGYTNFDSTFGTNTDNPVKIKAWISAKDGCDLNILGMDFISHNINSINFPNLNLELKKYPDIKNPISVVRSKSYSYLSFYQNVFLDKNITIAPKSSRVISISPAFKLGTSFRIDKSLEQKGINAKGTYCRNEIKSMPIVLKSSRESKVDINKGATGQTFENIEI